VPCVRPGSSCPIGVLGMRVSTFVCRGTLRCSSFGQECPACALRGDVSRFVGSVSAAMLCFGETSEPLCPVCVLCVPCVMCLRVWGRYVGRCGSNEEVCNGTGFTNWLYNSATLRSVLVLQVNVHCDFSSCLLHCIQDNRSIISKWVAPVPRHGSTSSLSNVRHSTFVILQLD
jgi:hypothetical protein